MFNNFLSGRQIPNHIRDPGQDLLPEGKWFAGEGAQGMFLIILYLTMF